MYLTVEEKEDRLRDLQKEIAAGLIDKELIEAIIKFNAIKGVCTTYSCSSHRENDRPYVSFRFSFPFEFLWDYIVDLTHRFDVTLKIVGDELPMYCFVLNQRSRIIDFLEKLESILLRASLDYFDKTIPEDRMG